ncbi:metal-dependent hydrolase [Candidatus Woesearchaeota archaeon]|nr:metal-dependent hydrolase [Candidatus Woesearchaeota archaeon]
MLFYTHLLIGVSFFLLIREIIQGINHPLFLVLLLLGSILPDIDERSSKINQWSGFLGKITAFFFRHRGLFHSLLFVFLLFLIATNFWHWYYGLAVSLGYFAHLLGDGLTPMGVQIFYPFSQYTIRGKIRTGSITEKLLMGLLLLFIIWMII